MNIEYQKMKSQILPASTIIHNFIQGFGSYSYEDYLLDIVNSSSLFLGKSNHQRYTLPSSEAHGECDCISAKYQIDFKLIASSSMLQAKSLFSPQITTHNGVTMYSGSRKQSSDAGYKPIQATRIFAALRRLSIDELLSIRHHSIVPQSVEQDINRLLVTLETDKHLLLFFPYNLYFDENDNSSLGLKVAIDGINSDFQRALVYRKQLCPQKDTYLCFLFAQHFIISEWICGKLKFSEAIPIEASPLFVHLLDLSEYGLSGGSLK